MEKDSKTLTESIQQTALVRLNIKNAAIEIQVPAMITVKELKTKIEKELEIDNIEFILIDGVNIYIGNRCNDHVITFPVKDAVDVSEWVFYSPSHNHYGRSDADVVCDNCGRHPSSCWGLPGMRDDLCGDCFKDYREGKSKFTPQRKCQSTLSQPSYGYSQPYGVR
jgi:hypothetical protein